MRVWRRLNRNHQILMRISIKIAPALIIVILNISRRSFGLPNRQVGQIFVRNVGVVGVGRVVEDLALLLLALGYQIIQLSFQLAELFLVFEHFEVAITLLRIHIPERVNCRRVLPTSA